MSKYIRLDEATDLFRGIDATMVGSFVADTLESLPTIDIVECDECLHKVECMKVVKRIDGALTWLNWCSFGERIEE